MPTVSVNGVDLYYEERGTGAPALFIHGMCGHANVWDDQVERLGPGLRCITYDRRGHTRSPLGEMAQRTVELHADDAAGLIRALGIAPCYLVASSGGARVAVDVVRRYPELLRGAVLSEPPLFALDPAGAEEFVAGLRPRIGAAMEQGGPRAAVDAFFEYVCPGLWDRIDDVRKEPYRANHVELFGDLQMPPYQVTIEDLRSITVPAVVLTGAGSNPLFRHVARLLAGSVPGARLVELDACGHVTYAEQPERFAEAVRALAGVGG
ncbi:MAG: alpha/beta hydrolase [Chloroflexota bacterium]